MTGPRTVIDERLRNQIMAQQQGVLEVRSLVVDRARSTRRREPAATPHGRQSLVSPRCPTDSRAAPVPEVLAPAAARAIPRRAGNACCRAPARHSDQRPHRAEAPRARAAADVAAPQPAPLPR